MLLKFEQNNTRMTIQEEMHKRFNDILRQYDNEVKENRRFVFLSKSKSKSNCFFQITEINGIFQHNKIKPPVNKNQPPFSGAVAWSRSLFRRIKHTMLRLHTKEALMQTELGKQVEKTSSKFVDFRVVVVFSDQKLLSSCCSRNESV